MIGLGARSRRRQRGVALVEFALIVPIFVVLLTFVMEFGFAFSHHLTLEYATREGARVGAALANGGYKSSNCPVTDTIDPAIIAAVQRVLGSPGSQVDMSQVSRIQIWKASSTGQPVSGFVNTWNNTGPGSGPVVDGQALWFSQASQPWRPCQRLNGITPDSIGVSLSYTYRMITPFAGAVTLIGGSASPSIPMNDQTVMALNPIG